MLRTTDDIRRSESPKELIEQLPAPDYRDNGKSRKVFLGAANMKTHTADAGWQLTLGFEHAGYELWGRDFKGRDEVDVPPILAAANPGIVVMQDKREWEGMTAGHGNTDRYRFRQVQCLQESTDLLKLTILKDCHQNPLYHRESANEIRAHGWVTYYHSDLVKHFAPYVRKEHLIRTYHSVDSRLVPSFEKYTRADCLLSGAVSNAYPLRSRILRNIDSLGINHLRHPGYHHNGCMTGDYLNILSRYKVAICTSSRYGYSLRKLIEATAAGCMVITDLPVDDHLPYIDSNLIRVPVDIEIPVLKDLIQQCVSRYSAERQRFYAKRAQTYYDWRYLAVKLADQIDVFRKTYGASK